MRSEILVQQAVPAEFERVGILIFELLDELYPELGYKRDVCIETAMNLLANGKSVWSFLATTSAQRDVGIVMLNECAAIYAGGRFGEISELYVVPDYRSKGVGARLIETAAAFGRERLGSTGQRNKFIKHVCWTSKVKCLAGALVQSKSDPIQVRLRESREIRAFGKVLA